MASLDLPQALDVARRAAEAGAAVAMRKRESAEELIVHAKAANDFVTDVDHAAQEAIIGIIRETFPDHRFLAEEEGADALGHPSSPYRWIIDPLDGTTNFIHGKTEFGTLLALQEDERTLVGVMVLPAMNEQFWAVQSGGAFVNGRRISQLRPTKNMSDAILCTNSSMARKLIKAGEVGLRVPPHATIHDYGCAAVMYAEILLGHNDGLLFDGPHLWDVAAGSLLVEEAGGHARYALHDSSDVRGKIRAVASTASIYGELEQFVFGK